MRVAFLTCAGFPELCADDPELFFAFDPASPARFAAALSEALLARA